MSIWHASENLRKKSLFEATKDLLLNLGYEGFTFSLLAEKLDVSRGALYKYYKNKEELVVDYMLFHKYHFMEDLKGIEAYKDFKSKFDFLIQIMYKHSKIHQILKASNHIPAQTNPTTKKSKEPLKEMHRELHTQLQRFTELGRREKILIFWDYWYYSKGIKSKNLQTHLNMLKSSYRIPFKGGK